MSTNRSRSREVFQTRIVIIRDQRRTDLLIVLQKLDQNIIRTT
jgi:hypothetical protein